MHLNKIIKKFKKMNISALKIKIKMRKINKKKNNIFKIYHKFLMKNKKVKKPKIILKFKCKSLKMINKKNL